MATTPGLPDDIAAAPAPSTRTPVRVRRRRRQRAHEQLDGPAAGIVLVDGRRLARWVFDHHVGATVDRTAEIVRMDGGCFEEESGRYPLNGGHWL